MTGSVKTRRSRLLIGVAAFLIGIPFFALLHNLLYALGGMVDEGGILGALIGFSSGASFIAALILCPAGAVICLVVALLDPVTAGWKTGARRTVLVVLPVVVAVAAIAYLGMYLSPSTRKADAAAGFNGSFEVVKSGLPANWYVYDRPLDDDDAEISFDTTEPIDGAQSLKMLVHRADADGGWRSPGLFQVIDAVEGETYRVSFWLKNQGCEVRLLIDSEMGESRWPRTPIREIIEPEQTGEGAWHQFVYTYTVPEHYSNVRFELNVVAPGTLWIDDVRIEARPDGQLD